jgi:hypothetical protein
MATKKDGNTDDPAPVQVRLRSEVIDRIDAHRARLEADAPGVSLSRSDAVRALLLAALEAAERPSN